MPSAPGSPIRRFQKLLDSGRWRYWWHSVALAERPPWVSSQRHSMNVAAPSLSQMSRHRRSATESPNHWWATSWTTSQV